MLIYKFAYVNLLLLLGFLSLQFQGILLDLIVRNWREVALLGLSKGWAVHGVVLTLRLVCARPGPGGPKLLKGLLYLGLYPTLEGQGRAQGLKKQENQFLIFFCVAMDRR